MIASLFLPRTSGKVVGIVEFQGGVIVATENGVYRMDGDRLVPIPFVHEPLLKIEEESK